MAAHVQSGTLTPTCEEEELSSMYCPDCGTKADDDDKFCQNCGKPLPITAHGPAAETAPAHQGLPPFPTTSSSSSPSYEPYPAGPPSSGISGGYDGPPGSAPPWQSVATLAGGRLSPFGAPLAGWWQRVGSMVLDSLILGVPLGIVDAVLNSRFGTAHTVFISNSFRVVHTLQGGAHTAVILGSIAVVGVYFSISNGTGRGQTVGNRAPGIGVRDVETGQIIGLMRGILRWFIRTVLYAALLLPGLLNDLFPLWDSRSQTIADKAARSVVIRLK
jgi:uncharacterized RDD family membrane protein YckC